VRLRALSKKRNQLTPNQSQVIQHQAVVSAWHGPLPSPADLAQFEQVLPGMADRIMTMAEAQGQHRREIESRAVTTAIRTQYIGVCFGFVTAMVAIGGGIYLIASGFQTTGLVSILATLVGLVSAFVFGRQRLQGDRASKQSGTIGGA
jgi:uncharacterized membrane protein